MNTRHTELIVSIRLTDEGRQAVLVPEKLTLNLGLQPTKTWKKGKRSGNWLVSAKFNGWELESGLPRTASLRDHLQALKVRVAPAEAALTKLARQWNATLWLVQYVDGYGQEIILENAWLKWASGLGLSVVVDTYAMGEG